MNGNFSHLWDPKGQPTMNKVISGGLTHRHAFQVDQQLVDIEGKALWSVKKRIPMRIEEIEQSPKYLCRIIEVLNSDYLSLEMEVTLPENWLELPEETRFDAKINKLFENIYGK